MLRFVTIFAAVAALALADPVPHNIFEIDISPEEAQKYLNSPPFTEPQLSGRTGVLPLVRFDSPNFRSAEAGPTLGHYWKNGREIENTDDYVEEVYDAAQFHGQDGLGAYTYGYRAPESSKVENRVSTGDVTGSYTYKDGNNELIKVRYWADSEGFHQEDNIPKVELKPVEEAEDVRQARLAHEKAWQEAAAAAAQQPDPQGEYDPAKYEYQGSPSEQQGSYAVAPQQQAAYAAAPQQQAAFAAGPQQQGSFAAASEQQGSFAAASEQQGQVAPAPAPREGKQYSNAQVQASYQNAQQFGKYGQQSSFGQGQQQQFGQGQKQQLSQSSQYYQKQQSGQFGQQGGQQGGQYGQQSGYGQHQQVEKLEEPEPTGPPRGFFYSFDYPVSIIVRKDAQGQTGPVNPGHPVDHDTVQQG